MLMMKKKASFKWAEVVVVKASMILMNRFLWLSPVFSVSMKNWILPLVFHRLYGVCLKLSFVLCVWYRIVRWTSVQRRISRVVTCWLAEVGDQRPIFYKEFDSEDGSVRYCHLDCSKRVHADCMRCFAKAAPEDDSWCVLSRALKRFS